jgi:hypothetical protein
VCEPDLGKEHSCAIKEAQTLQLNRNRSCPKFAESRDRTFVWFLSGIAEELERDMPAFRRRPAQPVPLGTQPQRDRRKLLDDRCRQWNPNKEAHTTIMIRDACKPPSITALNRSVEA